LVVFQQFPHYPPGGSIGWTAGVYAYPGRPIWSLFKFTPRFRGLSFSSFLLRLAQADHPASINVDIQGKRQQNILQDWQAVLSSILANPPSLVHHPKRVMTG